MEKHTQLCEGKIAEERYAMKSVLIKRNSDGMSLKAGDLRIFVTNNLLELKRVNCLFLKQWA